MSWIWEEGLKLLRVTELLEVKPDEDGMAEWGLTSNNSLTRNKIWAPILKFHEFISPEAKLRSSLADGENKFDIYRPCDIPVRQTGGTHLYE